MRVHKEGGQLRKLPIFILMLQVSLPHWYGPKGSHEDGSTVV